MRFRRRIRRSFRSSRRRFGRRSFRARRRGTVRRIGIRM